MEEVPERISARQKQAKDKQDHDKEIPVENIDWEKVTVSERESWKARFLTKEQELQDSMSAMQHGNAIYPVGRDRTYRRYWLFRSLPGLYIEDCDDSVPEDCLTPVPQTQDTFSSQHLPLTQDKPQPDLTEGTGSDKENDHKLVNGESKPVPADTDSKPGAGETEVSVEKRCPVLTESVQEQIARRSTVCWAYLDTKAQFDKLIESLNPRGTREGSLRTALLEQKEKVLSSLANCPVQDLTPAGADPALSKTGVKSASVKSRNKVTQGAVKNASATEFLELNLREMLLDLEERVYAGALGALKVNYILFSVLYKEAIWVLPGR